MLCSGGGFWGGAGCRLQQRERRCRPAPAAPAPAAALAAVARRAGVPHGAVQRRHHPPSAGSANLTEEYETDVVKQITS